MHRVPTSSPTVIEPPLVATHEAVVVSGGHRLHVQTFGHALGKPVLLLHGGPGSGQSPALRRPFDGARLRIVCIDQRGCGASTPRGGVEHNTTADLVADIEVARHMLGIERWLVAGGSWGGALAVAYAAAHPAAVSGLLLRSTFVARDADVAAFFAGSPLEARASAAATPLLPFLRDAMLGADERRRHEVAIAWWRWERAMSGGVPTDPPQGEALAAVIDRYRVQSHYLAHGCWLQAPNLLQLAPRLPQVPTLMLHGTDDRVCPLPAARELAACLRHARLAIIDGVGHDPLAPAMITAMRRALDHYARHDRFDDAGELAS